MKVTFIGGGSYRTLPIVRAALAQGVLNGGEVCLFDPVAARAETMARVIMRTPEFAGVDCHVSWPATVEEALDGADVVKLGWAVGNPVNNNLSDYASRARGFLASDNISLSGAFLALKAGPSILRYARMMEQYCPDAWLDIFTNPVAVYSGMVNNHTAISAFGICGGYTNHMWDLTRLLGADAQRDVYDVEVAGVNHLSFILRGRLDGRDLFDVLRAHTDTGWRPPKISNGSWKHLEKHIVYALYRQLELLQKFDTLIFSTEGDGMTHLFLRGHVHPASRVGPRNPIGGRWLRRRGKGERRVQQRIGASANYSNRNWTHVSGRSRRRRTGYLRATTMISRVRFCAPAPARRSISLPAVRIRGPWQGCLRARWWNIPCC